MNRRNLSQKEILANCDAGDAIILAERRVAHGSFTMARDVAAFELCSDIKGIRADYVQRLIKAGLLIPCAPLNANEAPFFRFYTTTGGRAARALLTSRE